MSSKELPPNHRDARDLNRAVICQRSKRRRTRCGYSAFLLTIMLCLGSQIGSAQSGLISGQVVKVDQSAKKITIKHGPTPKLDMPEGMTMIYAVSDPNMLTSVKAGNKINFDAERVNGQLTVTKIEKAR